MASLSSVQWGSSLAPPRKRNSSFSSWWGWWGSNRLEPGFFNSPGSVANYIFGTYSSKPTVLHEPGRTDGKLKLFANAHHKPYVIQNRPKNGNGKEVQSHFRLFRLGYWNPWNWSLDLEFGDAPWNWFETEIGTDFKISRLSLSPLNWTWWSEWRNTCSEMISRLSDHLTLSYHE